MATVQVNDHNLPGEGSLIGFPPGGNDVSRSNLK